MQTSGKLRGTLTAVLDWHRALPAFQQDRLQDMGFGDFLQLPVLQPDRPLLQALAERWDSWTNTFVLPVGLLTITLEDVVRLTILQVSGLPVAGTMESGLRGLASSMLGESAPIRGNTMLLGMFPSHFGRGVQTMRHRSDTAKSYARQRRRM